MTLIVVDQFRTTVDSHALVTDERTGDKSHEPYMKLRRLVAPIRHEFGRTFQTITVAGDAGGFELFLHKLNKELTMAEEADSGVTDTDLVRIASEVKSPRPTIAIIPSPCAVLVVTFGGGKPVEVEYRPGAVHGFGSDYEPIPGEEEETRAWFSIFIDAKRAGKLKDDTIHFMAHDSDTVHTDTLKPAHKAKKFRSRFPFRRRLG